ncbi:hypothetical protein [Estrella lausannensis]|uniref:Putative membrane protein n=1 Tax=Estrella lausannensis TaxID=483423 RepID=A0A0H5DQU8_9BACT|nr:hypothetical protein [Estrella lausannensis]CRX38483.1 putative membrane protein [Estrella lausannensis]
MKLNLETLFSKYITQPWSPELSLGEQILATISLVALAILTVGLVFPLTASLRGRKIDPISNKDKEKHPEVIKTEAVLKTLPSSLQHLFQFIGSAKLVDLGGKSERDHFMTDAEYRSTPPVISKSPFVPAVLAGHLMRNKKDSALGVKYVPGDSITNMEGAMHTFVTPITKIVMTGDYRWSGSHGAAKLNGGREVILSAAIHPDFERQGVHAVVLPIVALGDTAIEGEELTEDFIPLAERFPPSSKQFSEALSAYEEALKRHMVYHLTKEHRLPAREAAEGIALGPEEANQLLDALICDDASHAMAEADEKGESGSISDRFNGVYVNLGSHILSLEALYSLYLQQVINEFSALEATLPQGYVYTIDPPSIFAAVIGVENVALLNRLQLLALKELNKKSPLVHLKVIGFNGYADPKCLDLYKVVFEDKEVVSKTSLFAGAGGKYSFEKAYALVEHNNSDAFGQNIETEGASSKDGVIGVYSDAAHHLQRDRNDLLDYIV